MTPATPAHRYIFLDGLRGLAALTIVVHHLTATSGHRELFASASIAVDFFFCLSGFVIAHAYHAKLAAGMTLADYGKKRLARLYPMYLLGIVLGLFAIVVLKRNGLTDLSWEAIEGAFALNLFYLPYLNTATVQILEEGITGAIFPMNNPAWSLFFGLLANVLYAASIRVSEHAAKWYVAASAALLCAATAVYGEAPGWGTENFLGGFPRVLFSFFAGVLIFQLNDRTAALPRMKAGWVFALVILLIAVPRFYGHRVYWLVMAIGVMPILVAIGSQVRVQPSTLLQRVCTYSGRISYPLFCVHYPLLMLLSALPGDRAPFPLLLLGFVGTSLALAHVALTCFEDPLRSWISGKVAST
jgi:peptidoglycan/LPS O-acetylase OafA/YrhL